MNYQETFALVAKMNYIRILLSLAANKDLALSLVIKNVVLHDDLEEKVSMNILSRFEDSKSAEKVCKIKKSVYGLKQSPRVWFERLTRAIFKWGFKQSQGDHTLFIKHSSQGKIAALIVYVDDIVVTGDGLKEIMQLQNSLSKEFEIKYLGALNFFF